MPKHSRPTRWAATLFDAIIDRCLPFLDGWKQYPPQWTGNNYVGRHRKPVPRIRLWDNNFNCLWDSDKR